MANVFVALGANLNEPRQQLVDALRCLSQTAEFELLSYSSLYTCPPMGPQDQPDYINAVCQLNSSLNAFDTLQRLHLIENQFGRQRLRHWGERTLDLDLLLYDDLQSDNPQLKLPHPGIYERDFVLIPLQEIAAPLRLPNGNTVAEQVDRAANTKLQVVLSAQELHQQLVKE